MDNNELNELKRAVAQLVELHRDMLPKAVPVNHTIPAGWTNANTTYPNSMRDIDIMLKDGKIERGYSLRYPRRSQWFAYTTPEYDPDFKREIEPLAWREVVEPEPVKPALLAVGQRVEFTATSGDYHNGERGKIIEVDRSQIPYRILNDNGEKMWAKACNVKPIPDEPQPAPLKYKVGDIVLVPFKVVEANDPRNDDMPYGLTPLCDPDDDEPEWYSRAALEPERPAVGDRVVVFDAEKVSVGILKSDDHNTMRPFRLDDGAWYTFAYKLPA